MTTEPWWRRWPERLEWEKEQLAAHGITFRPHDPMVADAVRLDLEYRLDGVTYEMTASFADTYPFFRPVVVATTDFRFHQNVFEKQLCLLARDPALWSTDDSLAALIVEQLPKIVQVNAVNNAGAADLEEAVPEPVGENYTYLRPEVVFIDSAFDVPADVDGGKLTLALQNAKFPLRAAIQTVTSDDGRELGQWDSRLVAAFSAGTLEVPWVRLPGPIIKAVGDAFAEELDGLRPDLRRAWQKVPGHDKVDFDLVGVVYSDEVRYATTGDDWVFLLRVRQRGAAPQRGRSAPPRIVESHLVQAMRAGPTDLAARVPALSFLAERRIAIFGLGALGAPSAFTFARAGVRALTLTEPDHVEAGTTPRWPVGLTAAGTVKVDTVARWIKVSWPYTEVVAAEQWRLGTPETGGVTDSQVLNRTLEGVDLLFDATAHLGASAALADEAWRRRLPLVQVTATAGAWGGIVVRFVPGITCCRNCFMKALGDTIEAPPADPEGKVTPIACSDMTFVGAGFDLTPLADEAVRLAVATLSRGGGHYPQADWDVGILALRAKDGSLVPPTWTPHSLLPKSGCSECGA